MSTGLCSSACFVAVNEGQHLNFKCGHLAAFAFKASPKASLVAPGSAPAQAWMRKNHAWISESCSSPCFARSAGSRAPLALFASLRANDGESVEGVQQSEVKRARKSPKKSLTSKSKRKSTKPSSSSSASPETSDNDENLTSAHGGPADIQSADSNPVPELPQPASTSNLDSKQVTELNSRQDDDRHWRKVFPTYMQSKEDEDEQNFQRFFNSGVSNGSTANGMSSNEKSAPKFSSPDISKTIELAKAMSKECNDFQIPPSSSAQHPSSGGNNLDDLIGHDLIWAVIIGEAKLEAEREPLLSSFLYASILAHSCFEKSLSFVLANRLKNTTLLATQLMEIFDEILSQDSIRHAIRADVQAVKNRDPSCLTYSSALLYNKGYHAIQAYRISHALWERKQIVLALALQSRISEIFAVDIHPAARIGYEILLDHGTGVVIGETAVVGDRVSMLQGVTLGGTGKEAGDRHPKIGDGVLIGAGATILGNIKIGRGSMIAAGSLVLKDVKPHSMVAGTPARVVGMTNEPSPSLTMKHDATKDYYENDHGFGDSLYEGAGI